MSNVRGLLSAPRRCLMAELTPSEAAQSLLQRRRVRASLAEWARHKGFEPAKHHLLIINEIESFLASEEEVLLLFAPPGSAKSPMSPFCFRLRISPRIRAIASWRPRTTRNLPSGGAGASATILCWTESFSVSSCPTKARQRLAGRLQKGGEYYGVGAGVGISGFRADLGIIDDLFGKREDAYSETVRNKRWDWYVDDFSARLKPGAKRIIMNTRWHEDDVAGKVLAQIERKEIKGRVISIPAVAEADDPLGREPGEYLWEDPKGYDYGAFLRARQRETSPMMWAALYQQRPAPEEGDYFKVEWLK